MKDVVDMLIQCGKTISTMESCTGGAVVHSITNVEGASDVIKFSAVTYSNQFKIKMGVDSHIIDKYSVYSIETACSMSFNIAEFTDSNYGVGITGKLNRVDKFNKTGSDNLVYISIYDKDHDKYYTESVTVTKKSRESNKKDVVNVVRRMLLEIIM